MNLMTLAKCNDYYLPLLVYRMSSEETQTFLPEKIDRYPLWDLLDNGWAGSVYITFDPFTHEKIVMKLYNTTITDYQKYMPKIDYLDQLIHPSIIRIKDSVQFGNYKAIIMPYICGGDLYLAIQSGIHYSLQAATFIMWSLVDALYMIHQGGFTHGNIRLENILLRDSNIEAPDAVLTGFSRCSTTKIDINTIPHWTEDFYSPPEVKTTHMLTQKSDIYALGTVFYLLFSNLEKQNEDNQAINNLRELLAGMLRQDPESRYTIRDCMYHPFFDQHLESVGKSLLERETSFRISEITSALNEACNYDLDDQDLSNFI